MSGSKRESEVLDVNDKSDIENVILEPEPKKGDSTLMSGSKRELENPDVNDKSNIENVILELKEEIKSNRDIVTSYEERIEKIEKNFEKVSVSDYWMEGKLQKKTPLVKENPSHRCQMLPWFTKLTLTFACFFNYADTVSDFIAAADMFRNGKHVLGAVSVCVMVLVGIWIPFQTKSLRSTDEREGKLKVQWSWKNIFAAFTLSSTQYFVLKKFLLKHPEGKYDRRSCLAYNNEKCRTNKCKNLRHKIRQLHEGIILEKMCENLPQFILQIINIAPDLLYTNTGLHGFWGYSKITSLLLTTFSLAKACVNFDFVRLDLNPRLFSFYSIGKGWKALYPQKYLLVLIHSSAIACKGLVVIYLAILVNHDFENKMQPGWCWLPKSLEVVRSQSESSCSFENKVAWLLLLYMLVYFSGLTLIPLYIVPAFVYTHSIKNTLKSISSLPSRVGYVLTFVGNLWWIYILNFVMQQRHYMFDSTNHLPNIGGTKFNIKMIPSLLHVSGTVLFSVVFYTRGQDSFSKVHIGITPFHLVLVGVAIELIHLISLLTLVYWADPSNVQSLSDEKIVDVLLRKEIVGESVNVSCSKTAKDILKEIVDKGDFKIYKEDIGKEMIDFSRKLPPSTRTHGLAEFHRTFAEAIRKYSGVHRYSPVGEDEEDHML